MANIISKGAGKIVGSVSNLQQGEIFTSPVNKLWRAAILLNRATSPMSKDSSTQTFSQSDYKNKHFAKKGSYSQAQYDDPWYVNKIKAEIQGIPATDEIEMASVDYTAGKPNSKLLRTNEVIIVNTSTTPASSIILQNRPPDLTIEPGTTWASIKSFGRNNAFPIYTGSEDTLSFEISWYSVQEDREDVIAKCRLLESWSKANGYLSAPPLLNIIWGSSKIFENHTFILTSAGYRLSNFQDAYKNTTGQITDLKLLPNSAIQTLTFKRVSFKNLTHEDMIPKSKLSTVKGINQ